MNGRPTRSVITPTRRHGEHADDAVCRYVEQLDDTTSSFFVPIISSLTLHTSPPISGGLDEQVTDQILTAAFIPFGDLKDVNIPLDQTTQKNKGFGFVTFVERYVQLRWGRSRGSGREHTGRHRSLISWS